MHSSSSLISLGRTERWASALGGAALVVWGARRLATDRRAAGALLSASGAGLMWRARRGDDTRSRLTGARRTMVEEAVAINRSPHDLYAFWREPQRLRAVFPELTSVQQLDDRRSHWVARGPGRWKVEWYAEIINDIPNELIAWCTTGGADLVSAGSIRFETGKPGRGTVVRIAIQYDGPAGRLGGIVAKAFGDEPSEVIREGLRRFKQLMETGEIATTEGQPRGAR